MTCTRRLLSLPAVAVAIALAPLSACSADETADRESVSSEASFDCPLVDRARAERLTGATALRSVTEESGSVGGSDDKGRCSITGDGGTAGRLTVLATTVDPAAMTAQIRQEARTRDLDCRTITDAQDATAACTCSTPTRVIVDGVWGNDLVRVVLTPSGGDGASDEAYEAAREVAVAVAATVSSR